MLQHTFQFARAPGTTSLSLWSQASKDRWPYARYARHDDLELALTNIQEVGKVHSICIFPLENDTVKGETPYGSKLQLQLQNIDDLIILGLCVYYEFKPLPLLSYSDSR